MAVPAVLAASRMRPRSRRRGLLPDEDPTELHQPKALSLATWAPRDAVEHEAALTVIRAMWREMRAERLVLTDLFGAKAIAEPADATAAKAAALKAVDTMLRHRGLIVRERHGAATERIRGRRHNTKVCRHSTGSVTPSCDAADRAERT